MKQIIQQIIEEQDDRFIFTRLVKTISCPFCHSHPLFFYIYNVVGLGVFTTTGSGLRMEGLGGGRLVTRLGNFGEFVAFVPNNCVSSFEPNSGFWILDSPCGMRSS